jgi:hypothetical protein
MKYSLAGSPAACRRTALTCSLREAQASRKLRQGARSSSSAMELARREFQLLKLRRPGRIPSGARLPKPESHRRGQGGKGCVLA